MGLNIFLNLICWQGQAGRLENGSDTVTVSPLPDGAQESCQGVS